MMADIFVSYTSSDREWAFWIANGLRALDMGFLYGLGHRRAAVD